MCKRVERICQVDPEGWYAPVIGEELVRCKDCIKKELCSVYRDARQELGFCAWAVRKEE